MLISEPKGEDHNKNSHETAISSAANLSGVKEDRCQFTFSDGRRCRNRHAHRFAFTIPLEQNGKVAATIFQTKASQAPGSKPSAATSPPPPTSTAPSSQVFLLMAQGRVAQKQAVAFGYLAQLLLQTVPGIRSEYVSVHGYRAWEAKLKENLTIPSGSPSPAAKVYPQDELSPLKEVSLTPDTNEAPDPSPEGGGEEQERSRDTNEQPINGVVEREKGVPITPFLPHEKVPAPDYGDIFRRSRDMMAGKYDTTPEGRREANTLALELELMNPAPAKPPRDFFGRTVALVRRLRAHQSKKSGAASPPSTPPPPTTAPVPSFATFAPPPPSVAASEAAAKAVIPAASASPMPSDAIAREDNFIAPPCPEPQRASRRPTEKGYEQPSDQYPKTCRKQEMPVPGTIRARTEHTTDWYVPASWSRRQPDPFPSRKEKLRRSLRAASDRRLQHQMQNRAFWR